MSDRDVLDLIDRAAAAAPQMQVVPAAVVTGGRRKVARRRATSVGAVLGGMALAGAVWLGLGDGSVLGSREVTPASVTWEVAEPTTLTVLDGVTRGGNVSPLVVEKWPEGRTSATFTVEGVEETVEGTRMAGGADVFVGERATVVVWGHPAGASPGVDLAPQPAWGESGTAQDDEGVHYWATTDRGYLPEDIIFHTDRQVWTARGEVAETASVSDGRFGVEAFHLPRLGLAGVLDQGDVTFMEQGTSGISGYTEPWWRGSDNLTTTVLRVTPEADWARLLWTEGAPTEAQMTAPLPTVRVGDSAYAVFSATTDELDPAEVSMWGRYQWSADGQAWHDPDPAAEGDAVADLPTALDRVEFSVGADGEPVATKEGAELPPSAEQPAGQAWAWEDAGEQVVLVGSTEESWAPVLRTEGRLSSPHPFQDGLTAVRVDGRAMSAARLPQGTAYLGELERAAGPDEGTAHPPWADGDGTWWRLLDGEAVPSYDLGSGASVVVAVDEAQGLWFAMPRGDGVEPDLSGSMVGQIDGDGLALDVDGARHRVTVLRVTSATGTQDGTGKGTDAMPVLAPGSVVVQGAVRGAGGVSADEGVDPGVRISSTVVQCLKVTENCVEGLDVDDDGAVDLAVRRDTIFAWAQDTQPEVGIPVYGPGETVSIQGRDHVVRDTASGWPVLRPSGAGGAITTVDHDAEPSRADAQLPAPSVRPIPGAWPWSEDGAVVSVPGLVPPDDVALVVEVDGAWVDPEQVLVAQGRSGQVTLLVLEPGTTGASARVGLRDADGTVVPLPGLP